MELFLQWQGDTLFSFRHAGYALLLGVEIDFLAQPVLRHVLAPLVDVLDYVERTLFS